MTRTSKLHRYLERIGYTGPLSASLLTLRSLHRAHLLAIPYENIDVQVGRRVELGPDAAFEKIVERKRGGWCYEMNGLFSWVLGELGFDVTLIGSTPGRRENGDEGAMNHLVLLVHLDRPYIADVGWGNGFLLPLQLSEGTHSDGRFEFKFERVDGWWRFHNQRFSGDTFDFTETPYTFEDFAYKNTWLQESPDSKFVQNLVCHRMTEEGFATLRGAVLQTVTPSGITEEIAQSRDQLATILDEQFSLRPPEMDYIWERVAERHKVWLERKLRGSASSV